MTCSLQNSQLKFHFGKKNIEITLNSDVISRQKNKNIDHCTRLQVAKGYQSWAELYSSLN